MLTNTEALVTENILIKQQLLILTRFRQRALICGRLTGSCSVSGPYSFARRE